MSLTLSDTQVRCHHGRPVKFVSPMGIEDHALIRDCAHFFLVSSSRQILTGPFTFTYNLLLRCRLRCPCQSIRRFSSTRIPLLEVMVEAPHLVPAATPLLQLKVRVLSSPFISLFLLSRLLPLTVHFPFFHFSSLLPFPVGCGPPLIYSHKRRALVRPAFQRESNPKICG